jgi:hypothetical protein
MSNLRPPKQESRSEHITRLLVWIASLTLLSAFWFGVYLLAVIVMVN